jgi:hypothetical protein
MILDLREGRQPCSEAMVLPFAGPVLADRHGVQVLDFHQVGSRGGGADAGADCAPHPRGSPEDQNYEDEASLR